MISQAAVECMKTSKVPASVTIAQAALESNWGKSQLAIKGRNLFGVKADASWKGDVIFMETKEVENDREITITAKWRKYATWQESLDDHARFFHENKRYHICFEAPDAEAFAIAIHKAGYATDPGYSKKLIATMRARNLGRFDSMGSGLEGK